MYENLKKPITINGVEIRNRIFLPPMMTGFARVDHNVDDRAVTYYERFAKGGIGLITTEAAEISLEYEFKGFPQFCINRDEQIEGFRKIVDAVHAHGAKFSVQLFCREMDPNRPSVEMLHYLKDRYVDAALRAKAAGADGVEIHGGHANALMGTLMSAALNHRLDEYGGDVFGRGRLLIETVKAVREAVGPNFLISSRIGSDDCTNGGTDWKETILIIRELQKAGLDYVHLSNGSLFVMPTMFPPTGAPAAMHLVNQNKVHSAIDIPTGIVAKIKDPAIADMLIEQGYCDFVYIGRQQVADPEFANKVFGGRYEDVTPCIGCLECIRGQLAFESPTIRCSMNPVLADESLEIKGKATTQKRVAIIGGGPAGMEAAITAAERGHNVTLYEKNEHLGGQMFLASCPPSKQEYTRGILWFQKRMKDLGVEVKLSAEMTIDNLLAEKYDEYIVATGAKPAMPEFLKNTLHPQVVTAWDVLAGKVQYGANVVVIGGGAVGCETADKVATHWGYEKIDREVTVLEMADKVDVDQSPNRVALMDRLKENGVVIRKKAKVTEIGEDYVAYEQYGERHVVHDVNTVIVATGSVSVNHLADELKNAGVSVRAIGDAVAIDKIAAATSAGRKAAMEI